MFSSKDLFFTPTSGAFTVSKSLRFRSSATAYLNRTPAGAGSKTTWTWSGWVKRGRLGGATNTLLAGYVDASNRSRLYFEGDDTLNFLDFIGNTITSRRTTNAVFRDPSAWYHVVCTYDTTNATAGSRIRLYVNSVLQTYSSSTDPSLNYASGKINDAVEQLTGRLLTEYFDGYLAEVNFIGGSALDPTSFGEYDTNGVWQPKAYTGSYSGTNSFYLKFTTVGATSGSNTGYGQDFSGNGNYWTTNNFGTTSTLTTYDSMLDSPTNATGDIGNYCVLNPLDNYNNTVSDGNLTAILLGWPGGSNPNGNIAGSIAVTSGKYYWEVTVTAATSNGVGIGVARGADGITGYTSSGVYYLATGNSQTDGGTATAYGATYGVNDVIGVALDATGGTVTFYKQTGGTGSFTAYSALTLPSSSSGWKPKLGNTAGSGNSWTIAFNAGQRPLNNTIPSGYSALNTQNLTTPTITNGAQYMAATTYTGAGAIQSINNGSNTTTSISFQPDLVWLKSRSRAGSSHYWYDAVRGVTKSISSDSTGSEQTIANTLTAFNSDGFTLGSIGGDINASGSTFIAWQWNAGGSTVTNTTGSISAQVRANTTAGFSVITWTGSTSSSNQTVGHGLGVTPSLVILKNRNFVDGWYVWSSTFANTTTDYLVLNTTAAKATAAGTIWGAGMTSSLCGVRPATFCSASTDSVVMYCFAPVAGYSAFGSYTGNGSADGPFVYTGFRPRWIMGKCSSAATSDWFIYDTSRATYNASTARLYADTSGAETTGLDIDILSNGFKFRALGGQGNDSGSTYIFAAFAENPFKISRAR